MLNMITIYLMSMINDTNSDGWILQVMIGDRVNVDVSITESK